MRNSLILMIAVLCSGCASKPPMTMQQLETALKENQTAATRLYAGKSQDEVRKGAQQVLYLLDPPDMKFNLTEGEVLATRAGSAYLVLANVFVRDWYSVFIQETPSGTFATFGFDTEETGGDFVAPIGGGFKTKIPVTANANPADYKLFHDRLEYVLGIRKEWVTCKQAKDSQVAPKRQMTLCDQFGLENLSPDQASIKQ